jgi:hypothetical protein
LSPKISKPVFIAIQTGPGPVALGFMLTFSRNEQLEHQVAMKKTLSIILVFALFNCGCSTVGLFYRNADWYLQHKIEDYTTFTSLQKETIRKDISDYMVWHRKVALPEYIIFLQNLNWAAQYDGQLKAEETALLRAQLMNLYRRSLVPAIRPAAQMLSSLDSAQIQELKGSLAKENSKQKKEELDIGHDKYLETRADKTITFLQWLAGSLSVEQEQQVRDMSRHLPVVSPLFIQHREANQATLIRMLNDKAGADKIDAFMSSWILTPEATRTAQQQSVMESFETASDAMIAQILGQFTARQKDHLHDLIASYIKEMQSLSTEMQTASETRYPDK